MAILKKIYNHCSKNSSFKKIEKKIVNEYLINEHHITINDLENWIKNYQKIQTVTIDNVEFNFIDNLASNTIDIVKEEMQNASVYDFSKLAFKKRRYCH